MEKCLLKLRGIVWCKTVQIYLQSSDNMTDGPLIK